VIDWLLELVCNETGDSHRMIEQDKRGSDITLRKLLFLKAEIKLGKCLLVGNLECLIFPSST